MAVTTVPVAPASTAATAEPRVQRNRRTSPTATILLLLGAAYCLMPVLWVVVASTKSASELFTTFTFAPSTQRGTQDMYSRSLEQLASERPRELRATSKTASTAGKARRSRKPLRRQTGWALVSIGLRLAESGSR